MRGAYIFFTFLVFAAALSISFDLGGFGDDFGKVWGGFWEGFEQILDRFELFLARVFNNMPLAFLHAS